MGKGRRSQSAVEFVITYGLAFLVVLVCMGVLFNYFFKTPCMPNFQMSSPELQIHDQIITGSNSPIAPSRNLFFFTYRNNMLQPIIIKNIRLLKGVDLCSSVSNLAIVTEENKVSNVIIGRINNSKCTGRTNECYRYDLFVDYTYLDSSIVHTSAGVVTGKYTWGEQAWYLEGPWRASQSHGSILDLENRAGEPINYCVNEPPPSSATLNVSLSYGTLFWDLPSGCDVSGITDPVNGFGGASCGPRNQLAKGWMHNSLYLDKVFSTNKIYLGGDATYYDNVQGRLMTNGICLNDNLYFYVNGVMKYYGGTSGKMIGADNQYDLGDEVMRGCGNCQPVDSSAWCIPAFELGTNGFVFGQSNNIDILVEDFCIGVGAPHAGGISELNVQLV